MERFLKQYSPYLYATLRRIFAGLMFAMHGSQKVFGIPGDKSPVPLASLLGVGATLELVCGLLIALGLVASYAAFIASGGMAVCYFVMHFPQGFLPILNQGELAVLYCFLFLYIAAQGSGVWSIEALLGGREKPAVLT
ncbi:DoxX family protein [Aliterella atlantica]|uniref:DoxX family protein n=1 Tax=Aliterella atlantica CENA595 TaxID=1618023 RepID=A0A0D8ZRR6_9CYAN|nr:DoxX family protein [Aliterella atlantica]KJH71047.1 DoxX family protein [Aliterella atlantica CENA595]